MTTKATPEVLPLTALRFFLASWIVIYHVESNLPAFLNNHPTGFTPFRNTLLCAYVAVGIFFALSGFILALNYPLDRLWDTAMRWKFAVARFSRIYPVYLLGLVLIAPLIVGNAIADHSLPRHGASLGLNLLMLQAWVPRAAVSWNGPGWSLSNEAFFYLCFPFIGAPLYRLSSVRKALLAFLGLWALELIPPAVTVLAHVHGFGDAMATAQPADTSFVSFISFNPLLNLPIFLSGILACRIYLLLKQSGTLEGQGYKIYLPSLAVLFALTSLGNHIFFPIMRGGLILPSAIGVIVGLAMGDRYLGALMSNRVLVFLGKASYAEYLLHFPVGTAFNKLGLQWTPLNLAGYFAAVLAVSALVFHFYEEPLQRKLRNLLLPRRIPPIATPSIATSSFTTG